MLQEKIEEMKGKKIEEIKDNLVDFVVDDVLAIWALPDWVSYPSYVFDLPEEEIEKYEILKKLKKIAESTGNMYDHLGELENVREEIIEILKNTDDDHLRKLLEEEKYYIDSVIKEIREFGNKIHKLEENIRHKLGELLDQVKDWYLEDIKYDLDESTVKILLRKGKNKKEIYVDIDTSLAYRGEVYYLVDIY